ncbi:MAG TPA: hypothetical protein VJ021_03700 [Thermoplasmata archaeon]|nr:hypothetical protein [Thermoplasmata archaeon]
MAESRVEVLPKARAKVYLRRAENLLKTMEWAEREQNPDGVAINAVQTAISLGDAFTVFFLQERSRGQDHHEVVGLATRCKSPAAAEVGQSLHRILYRKNEVEYEGREVLLSDARELAKQVRRLSSLVHIALS